MSAELGGSRKVVVSVLFVLLCSAQSFINHKLAFGQLSSATALWSYVPFHIVWWTMWELMIVFEKRKIDSGVIRLWIITIQAIIFVVMYFIIGIAFPGMNAFQGLQDIRK